MPTVNLTDRKVASLRPRSGLAEYWDAKTPGFGIRVSPRGLKTWFVMFRIAGIRRRLKLGRYPIVSLVDARKKANAALSSVAETKDPILEKKAEEARMQRERLAARTFAQLASQYLDQYAKRQKRERTWKEYERIIKKHLLPEFGKLDTVDILQSHVRSFLHDLASRRPVLANRTRAVMGAIFNWAIAEEILLPDNDPVAGVRRPGGKETPRERELSDNDIKIVWDALEAETTPVRDALWLILLTAQRPGEVMGMRVDEIDFDESLWSIPAWRTKPKRATVVPLSAQAMRIINKRREEIEEIRRRREQNGDPAPMTPFVFPNRHLAKYDKEAMKMLGKMVDRVIDKVDIEPFTPHDLRRTCATNLGKMGVPEIVMDLLLNHALKGVTNTTYNRYKYLKERREALDRWGLRVHQIVTGMKLADRGSAAQA